jgi:RyR domain
MEFVMTTPLIASNIARICHEVNKAFCHSIGDDSQPSWDAAPEWQKDSAISGVLGIISGEIQTPSDSHKSWMKQKEADGWIYGDLKNPDAKPPTHPCMVPYDKLPVTQQTKDYLFFAVVRSYLDGINSGE